MTGFGLTAAMLAERRLFGVGNQRLIEDRWRSNMNRRLLSRRRSGISAFTALAVAGLTICFTTPTQASTIPNLMQNPGFTATTPGLGGRTTQIMLQTSTAPLSSFAGAGIGPWTVSGLAFLFGPDSRSLSGTNADLLGGAPGFFGTGGGFCLWGPSSGSGCFGGAATNNGLTIGPSKGAFLAMDGALSDMNGVALRASISETITGLTPGVPVTLGFDWAAAQQTSFSGPNTEQVQVSLGSQTQSTAVVMNASHGFIPWMHQDFTFTPNSSSELLSFLAIGTPAVGTGSAGPPFVLLDGRVELQSAVPEPATWTEVGVSFLSIVGFAYRRRKSVRIPDKAGDA